MTNGNRQAISPIGKDLVTWICGLGSLRSCGAPAKNVLKPVASEVETDIDCSGSSRSGINNASMTKEGLTRCKVALRTF